MQVLEYKDEYEGKEGGCLLLLDDPHCHDQNFGKIRFTRYAKKFVTSNSK